MSTEIDKITLLKIERNNIMQDILIIQEKIVKLEMVIKYRMLKKCTEKQELLKKINGIEHMQLYNYDFSREHQIIEMTNQINIIDINTNDIKKDMADLIDQYHKSVEKIKIIQSNIPDKILLRRTD